jgi:hypothetical protein
LIHLSRGACRGAVIAVLSAALLLGLAAGASAAAPGADSAGTVHYAKHADSAFDRFTKAPSAAQQGWMRDHYWRMKAYAPYFDSRTSWYGNAWFYKDAYAIYPSSPLVTQHPDWILRDARGNKLYIQFACNGTTCTQYAGDIGSPEFRANWIADAKARLAHGYKGAFIDDVNMEMRVSDGTGHAVAPIDPRTGQPMTLAAWRRYMADFMVQVRAALPGAEIVHNALWFDGDRDPDVARELHAADLIEIERGINDRGLVGGHGKYGIQTWLDFVDHRHADGKGVILDASSGSPAGRLYGLAGYLLLSSGRDALADNLCNTPNDWWSAGYDVNLGSALGARYKTPEGVWRRDFAGGTVLVNEPGAPTRTVTVPAGLRDLDGATRTSVTLGPASGAVLVGSAATTTPAGTATKITTAKPVAPPAPKPVARPKPRPPAPAPARARSQSTRARVGARSHRHRIRVSGRVRGARSGRVDLLVQRRVGHRWVRVVRVTARVSHGRFVRMITARPGRYRVQARFRGTAIAKPSRSHFRRFVARG